MQLVWNQIEWALFTVRTNESGATNYTLFNWTTQKTYLLNVIIYLIAGQWTAEQCVGAVRKTHFGQTVVQHQKLTELLID